MWMPPLCPLPRSGSRRAGQPAPEDGSTHGISAGEGGARKDKMPAQGKKAERVALMMQMPSQRPSGCTHSLGFSPLQPGAGLCLLLGLLVFCIL